MNYNDIKTEIRLRIDTTGSQGTTGEGMQKVLNDMVDYTKEAQDRADEFELVEDEVFKETAVSILGPSSQSIDGYQGHYYSFGLFSKSPAVGDKFRLHFKNTGFKCSEVWVGLLDTSWQVAKEITTREFTGAEDETLEIEVDASNFGAISFRPLQWGTAAGTISVQCWIVTTDNVVAKTNEMVRNFDVALKAKGIIPLLESSDIYGSYNTNNGELYVYSSGPYKATRPIKIEGVKYLYTNPASGFSFLYYSAEPANLNAPQPNYMGGQYQVENRVPEGAKYVVIGFSDDSGTLGEYSVWGSDKPQIFVDCLGDSLTMGSATFGFWVDTLQGLLGRHFQVRNYGVGGETSATIMARQGSAAAHAANDFTLKANKTTTTISTTGSLPTEWGSAVPLLQGADNMVNPCYVQGVECTLAKSGNNYTIKRNATGSRDILVSKYTPITMNTGKKMAASDIAVVWIGTNDSSLSADAKVALAKQCVSHLVTDHYVVMGAHGISNTAEQDEYESKMLKEFGAKFFNIRAYSTTQMIYDAGITPTAEDLSRMAARQYPYSLCVSDHFHFNPQANVAIGKYLYNMFQELGYVTGEE